MRANDRDTPQNFEKGVLVSNLSSEDKITNSSYSKDELDKDNIFEIDKVDSVGTT